jgi:phosphonate transport system substrate-binding protein
MLNSNASENDLKSIEKTPVVIDLDDVVETSVSDGKSVASSPLNVAVAAMISPEYTYKYYLDLLKLIGENMGREITFVQKKTYSEVNKMLKQKELDLAFVCSGPYVSGKKEFGMEIIAIPVCNGKKVYYSYFIASKRSGIKTFDDLKGKTFAFTDPLSNTGFLVPSYFLAQRGETADTFFKKTFFTHSHDNSIHAVINGLADGAAVDSLIYEFISVIDPELIEKTVIIKKSSPYGIPPVVVNPLVDEETKERLRNIFLTIHKSPEGKECLKKLHIDRFVKGNDEDYESVRELQEYLSHN